MEARVVGADKISMRLFMTRGNVQLDVQDDQDDA
jgi:hypothetical protein